MRSGARWPGGRRTNTTLAARMLRTAIGLALLLTAPACDNGAVNGVRGSGVVATEIRPLDAFDEIDCSFACSLEVSFGEPTPLELTADDNLLALIETTVADGRLTIRPVQKIGTQDTIRIRVSTPQLGMLAMRGAGDVDVRDVDNEQLVLDLSGTCAATASGRTQRLEVNASGSVRADLFALEAQNAVVALSGSGGVELRAAETLDVTVSGVGSVTYRGDPKVTKSITGLGLVEKE